MELQSFRSAYTLMNQLYGVEMPLTDWEEIAMIAWDKIGNRITRLYKFSAGVSCVATGVKKCGCSKPDYIYSLELPCNCDEIEAVTTSTEDWNYTTNKTVNGDYGSLFTEEYIEMRKRNKNPLYASGSFVKYEQVGNTLYFPNKYPIIHVLYKGIMLDEDGLPYITERTAVAIAAYCALTRIRREGFITKNATILQMAETIRAEWNKLCSQARAPYYLSQNELNEILDVNSRWDRKVYNKSFKPVM